MSKTRKRTSKGLGIMFAIFRMREIPKLANNYSQTTLKIAKSACEMQVDHARIVVYRIT